MTPQIVQADLWNVPPDQIGQTVFVVTTNNVITPKGLVMGAGAAKQAATRYPGLPRRAAAAIRADRAIHPGADDYGFLMVDWPLPQSVLRSGLGLFQVKRHYRLPADLNLIRLSVEGLTATAICYARFLFRLNFPGIGEKTGQLARTQVEPLLANLPDNVTICWRV